MLNECLAEAADHNASMENLERQLRSEEQAKEKLRSAAQTQLATIAELTQSLSAGSSQDSQMMQATLIVDSQTERINALTLELRRESAEHAKQLQSSTLTQQHLRQQVDSQNEQLRRLERLMLSQSSTPSPAPPVSATSSAPGAPPAPPVPKTPKAPPPDDLLVAPPPAKAAAPSL